MGPEGAGGYVHMYVCIYVYVSYAVAGLPFLFPQTSFSSWGSHAVGKGFFVQSIAVQLMLGSDLYYPMHA